MRQAGDFDGGCGVLWLYLSVSLVLAAFPRSCSASAGDMSPFYLRCVRECFLSNCSTVAKEENFRLRQPLSERALSWDCEDECGYNCMWDTVDKFESAGHRVPQFHGKWPFARWMGVQEPASAFFSLCNLVPHLVMQARYQKQVGPSAPMHRVWTAYGIVSVNTWIWSTVFHSRDFEFTERMDYFCAFSIVSYSLAAFFLRFFGTDWNFKSVAAVVACASVFARHIYFMAFVKFDYGHNMKVNIAVGAVNSACWLAWCAYHRGDHSRWCALAVVLLNASVLLELLDFPPLLWTFDSHSLWHASTAPVHFVWYKFVIEDGKRLMKGEGGGESAEREKKLA